MKTFKFILITLTLFSISNITKGQDTIQTKKNVKTGWNLGALPTITYNTDLGFQYGALVNLYQYGDGKVYPKYYHSLYAEISRYTKGSGIMRFFYDSKYLIPNIRLTADLSYLTEQALHFYGFNGYQTVYNKDWEDDSSSSYKTRIFYRHQRKVLRGKIDFQGETGIKNVNWAAGINLMNVDIRTVNIDRLNKGKDENEALKDTNTLYDNYINWGIITPEEKNGGFFTSLKGGIVYDSRDNEPNPMKGIWSEAVILQTFNQDFTFTKIAITHRQYFTLVKNKLSLVYRLGYQGIIAGDAPFYALPYMVSSFTKSSNADGLGGSKTVRGMMRNRVVGEAVAYGNFEFRWKFVDFVFKKQNIYFALNPFMDFGQVVKEKEIDFTGVSTDFGETINDYFNGKDNANGVFVADKDKLHITYGAGLHIAMNQNFIVAADVGFPTNKQDGGMGVYIGLNFLF
jgi:hypothetical protein